MRDRRRIMTRLSKRLRRDGFVGRSGMLRRPARDGFFLLVHMRQFMAPIAGDFQEALLAPSARVPAIEIMVGLHAREMYLASELSVPRVEELRSCPMLPSIHVVGPTISGNVTGAFLVTDSLDEEDMVGRVFGAVDDAEAAFGSRDRVIETWGRMKCLPGMGPDSSALCVAFLLGLNGDLPGAEAIIEGWMPRLTAAHLITWFEESRDRLRQLAASKV